MAGFLYGQTEYNILKSSLKLEDYVLQAKDYGYTYLSITDANMFGTYKFYSLTKKYGIKPILGLEIKLESFDNYDNKFLVYALNNQGYKTLLYLSTLMFKQKTFSVDFLSQFSDVIFISTMESDFIRLKALSDENLDVLTGKYKSFKHFGLGISFSNPFYNTICQEIYNYSLNSGIKCYPLSQTLYNFKEDIKVVNALREIEGNSEAVKGDYHYKTLEELKITFLGYNDVFLNLDELVGKINIEINPVSISLPKFPKTNGLTSKEFLLNLAKKGLKRRLEINHIIDDVKYNERLLYELSIINKMGYDDYFLIVWDYVLYAKKNGVMVGPGRGSAAGSLVAYCLGITNVDPLKYDLLFERFLNPERVSMPDIDMDFPDDKREFVIDYVKETYGKDRVCNICTFGTFKTKSSIRDLGKALNISSDKLDLISKIVSENNDFNKLKEDYKDNEQIFNLFDIASKIEGLPRHISTHASGIIISNDKLICDVPLQDGINDMNLSQYDQHDLEELGLLKMDFLGLSHLNIIDDIVHEIPNMNNINILNIPLDDKKTYELLSRGDTLGVFQVESEGFKRVLRKLKPTNFLDIVALIALNRPGPMEFIDEFIERKNGKPFTYIHKDLKPILESTYGIIVYQEQIMRIGYEFAGMSLGEADILRRAVSKKNKDVLDENRKVFVSHTKNKGYSLSVANDIYDLIVKFANYGFNKNHSVAYSLVVYQMAYFKANYFSIFISKILNSVIGNAKMIGSYIDYAKKHRVKILTPDINVSTLKFVIKNNSLIYPLQGVNGVGSVLAAKILEERKNGIFTSLKNFKDRVEPNQKALENLIYSGAFDSFGHTRKAMIEESTGHKDTFDFVIGSNKVNKKEEEYNFDYLKEQEAQVLGLNIAYDLFRNIDELKFKYRTVNLSKLHFNQNIKTLVSFKTIKTIKTKNNDMMFVGTIYDGLTELNFIAFPQVYAVIKNIINLDKLFLVQGKITLNKDKTQYEFRIDGANEV